MSEREQVRAKKVYQAPVVTRVHVDPVKDLLAACAKADGTCLDADGQGEFFS